LTAGKTNESTALHGKSTDVKEYNLPIRDVDEKENMTKTERKKCERACQYNLFSIN